MPKVTDGTRNRQTPEVWEPDEKQLRVYKYVLSGKSTRRAAAKFGYSHTRIAQICRKIDDYLSRTYMGQIRQIKANHTQRLEIIYNEAMAAWRRSQQDAETVTETDRDFGEKNSGTETKKTIKGQTGAAQFLSEARGALNEIRNIWGANAPLQIEHAGEVRVAGRPIEECRAELLEKVQRICAPQPN